MYIQILPLSVQIKINRIQVFRIGSHEDHYNTLSINRTYVHTFYPVISEVIIINEILYVLYRKTPVD